MIKVEIVCQTIAEFREKVGALFAFVSGGVQPAQPVRLPDDELPEGMVRIPMEKPAEVKATKRRATKGAGSEPEVVEAKDVVVAKPVEQPAKPTNEVTEAMVREALLALLQIGEEVPEEVLSGFHVKKISALTAAQYSLVHEAATIRLKEWQDSK